MVPSRMLRRFLILAWAVLAVASAGARPATPEEASLLNELLHKTASDLRRWAYTEHRIMRDHEGKVKSDHLVRYDPSKPYAEQWTPLKINGREPSDRDRARYRKRGEQSPEAKQGPVPGVQVGGRDSKRVALGEVIDVPRATIAEETATHLVYEIPLRKVSNERFPPEKFIVHARVRKEGRVLENISAKLRESFRAKLVVKVKSGEGSIDFAQVDPEHPATMVKVAGDATASILFFNIGGSMSLTRTDLKRVRPFDERFEVQIGNLKAIDF
ncbi:MAG TPA: hypothetical protein VGE76_23685 [Opitutaceae bacterium]